MFHILGFLFIIIIAILIIGVSIIGTVLRSVFGLKKRNSSYSSYNNTKQSSGSSRQQETEEKVAGNPHPNKRKKLFSKDEGEYVDFEEVKE